MAFDLASRIPIGPEDVGIALSRGALGSHLGVAYCDENGNPRLLHFAWHRQLKVDPYPPDNPTWIASIMLLYEECTSQAVALVCGMADKYGNKHGLAEGIEYGINLFVGGKTFDLDGTYRPSPDNDGVTCATIISKIFNDIGFPLVDLKTWKPNAINKAWGNAIVCMLEATHVNPAHIERVKMNVSGLRLRPEEVAAAGELNPDDRPAPHSIIEYRADELLRQIDSSCGSDRDLPEGPFRPCIAAYRSAVNELFKSRERDVRRRIRAKSKFRSVTAAALKFRRRISRWQIRRIP